MADFSSRGGPGQGLGVSKPDITAPGVNILAAQTPALAAVGTGPLGELFQVIRGTSMSSPHIAGAAALLKQLYPSFTPGQIKSALMTTATVEDLVDSDGVSRDHALRRRLRTRRPRRGRRARPHLRRDRRRLREQRRATSRWSTTRASTCP